MPTTRRAALSLLLLSITLLMAIKLRSQNRATVAKPKSSPQQSAGAGPLRPLIASEQQWVDATMRRMTLDEKVGQLLFTTFHGTFTSTESAEYKKLVHDVTELHVGGFIVVTHITQLGIEKSQTYPTAALANQLQSKAKLPLLIGADFERGAAMRLDEGTSFPTQMAVAAGSEPRDAYTMGKITAIEARQAGVQWIYAPVADVNNNPGNPIINTRSFGEDPKRVAEFVAQYVHGVEENGGLATAKHFPGHGDTAADSHIDLPVIRADRGRLDSLELVPFRSAIAAGAGSIMTGHLNVPALEPDPNTPATLSSHILTNLLRDDLRFQGLVVTDAMDMGGITVRFAPGEAAVRAVLAGADCLLMPPVPDAAFEALQQAVRSGRISRERIDASVRRILEAKARLGLNKNRLVDLTEINAMFAEPSWQNEAQSISDRGITLLPDAKHSLPLDGTKSGTWRRFGAGATQAVRFGDNAAGRHPFSRCQEPEATLPGFL